MGDEPLIRIGTAAGPSLLLIRAGSLLRPESWPEAGLPRRHALIVTDSNVGPLWAGAVMEALDRWFESVHLITIPAGEDSKSVELLWRLWEQFVEFGATRESVVFALGGGVVGDLAGFAAATFMRGVPLVQMPTTLLAQVDSSVGGKTGINLPAGKNLAGAFWQPRVVVIDPEVLETLPERELRAGFGEVVKSGMIFDAEFVEQLERDNEKLLARDRDVLTRVIRRCCQLKAAVVAEDEWDQSGLRARLNYGHTFGHAIEQAAGYGSWLHGEAVAAGMNCAAALAVNLGMLDPATATRQRQLLRAFGLPPQLALPPAGKLLAAMKRDKKQGAEGPRLILLEAPGRAVVHEWPGDGPVAAVLDSEGVP